MSKSEAIKGFEKWNRKIHIYLGLFLLLFLWLFSISGLFMNHPKWFHGQMERTPNDHPVTFEGEMDPVARAHDLKEQLGLEGEILLRAQRNPQKFFFLVLRPRPIEGDDTFLFIGRVRLACDFFIPCTEVVERRNCE